jgi:hypothetical protein
MRQRRPLAMGLSVAAVALVIVGVVALVFDAGAGGNGGIPSPSGTVTNPTATSARTPVTSAVASTSIASPSPSKAGASASPSASPSAGASASPAHNASGFVATADGFAWHGSDGTVVPVPQVPGLTVALRSGRAIYYAVSPNRFGLKVGSYAGEFMPQVTTGRADGSVAQTGGLVMSAPVVVRLTNDALAAAATETDRWIVALPVDIRNSAAAPVSVLFDRYGLSGWSNTPRVVIRFSGMLPVTEAVASNDGFHVLVEQLGVTRWQVIDPLRLTLPTDAIDPAHAMNELLIYGSGTPSATRDVFFDARMAVGSVMLRATGDVSVSLVVPGSRADLGPDKILSVGDVPVFVSSN